MLGGLAGVTSVHSRFYDLSSKYYQTIGNHASYYKDALRFLGCTELKDLPSKFAHLSFGYMHMAARRLYSIDGA